MNTKHVITLLLSFLIYISAIGQRQNLIFESSFEDSTLSDWTSIQRCTVDRVKTSTAIKKIGIRSARFYSTLQDTLGCTQVRSQLIYQDVNLTNYERWYGFSIYLGASYPQNYDGVENILEFLRTDTLEEYYPLSLGYHGFANGVSTNWPSGKYITTTRVLRTQPPASPYTIFIDPIQTVNNQQWVDVVMRVKWSNDTSGRVRVWVNDVLRFSYNGITNYAPNKLRLGIDKWDWRLKWNVSSTIEREIYIDEFRIGNELATYNDVRPGVTNPLPIHWYNFTATKTNQGVRLDWEAEFGTNFNKFIVERNTGSTWVQIGTVYSNPINEYTFTDKNPQTLNQYRIRALNFGEPDSYSNIRVIRYSNGQKIKISIYNPLGQLVKVTQIDNNNLKSTINSLHLRTGIYFVRYENGQTEKIFVE